MNIAGDKMMAHLDRICGDKKPITADIFLTNFCNNACPYCTYRRWGLDGSAHSMSFDEFVQYATRLKKLGVLGFVLSGGGEPTVNPYFVQIAEWLTDSGLHWGVNTNFNTLQLVRPDYIKVSLDGWDEESYSRSRGVRAYERTKWNIRAYSQWKKENSPTTSLGIQMVADSVDSVKQFYDANMDLDVDYIVFRPKESTGGKEYSTEKSMEDAMEIIKTVNEMQTKDKRVTLNFKWNLLGNKLKGCAASWAQIAVNDRGQVMYCCHKPYEIIGHVLDDDILQKKELAKTDMAMCDVPCRMTAPNLFVGDVERKREDANFI